MSEWDWPWHLLANPDFWIVLAIGSIADGLREVARAIERVARRLR